MPLLPKEILAYRKTMSSKNKDKAICEIAMLDTKQSIPVIIKILNEILTKLKQQDSEDINVKDNIHFLELANLILSESDRIQSLAWWRQALELPKISKTKMVGDLDELKKNANKVHINEQTITLWQEAAYWLEGMYHRTYDRYKKEKDGKTIKRDKNGLVEPIDTEDKAFHGIFKLNKIDIANYYHEVSEILEKAILLYANSKGTTRLVIRQDENHHAREVIKGEEIEIKCKDVIKPPLNPPRITKVIENLEEEDKEVNSTNTLPEIQAVETNGQIQIIINVPPEQRNRVSDIIMQVKMMLTNSTDKTEEDSENISSEDIYLLLKTYEELNDEVRFATLMFIAENYQLNHMQTQLFSNFKESILANLNAYINSKFNGIGIPTYLYARSHTAEVTEAILEIKGHDVVTESLKTLYKLWNEVKGKGSAEVKEKARDLLSSAYTILYKSVDPNAQIKNVHAMRY